MAEDVGALWVEERPRLLLVDADAVLRRSLQLALRARGFDVRAYAAGAALLADPLARNACCIVAEYRQEAFDGIELLGCLRASGWPGAALLMTDIVASGLVTRALAHGFSQVLEKPFHDQFLVDAVVRMTPAMAPLRIPPE